MLVSAVVEISMDLLVSLRRQARRLIAKYTPSVPAPIKASDTVDGSCGVMGGFPSGAAT
jgi:hypothetical protein